MLEGRIDVFDAAFTDLEICEAIVEGKGHDLLPLEYNPPTHLNAMSSEFTGWMRG